MTAVFANPTTDWDSLKFWNTVMYFLIVSFVHFLVQVRVAFLSDKKNPRAHHSGNYENFQFDREKFREIETAFNSSSPNSGSSYQLFTFFLKNCNFAWLLKKLADFFCELPSYEPTWLEVLVSIGIDMKSRLNIISIQICSCTSNKCARISNQRICWVVIVDNLLEKFCWN